MAIDLIGLQALQDEKTLGKLEIDTHTEASITQLATATEGYKEDLENEKDALIANMVGVDDVIAEGNTQVTRVETTGTTEVANVEAKGTEVKAEIDTIIQGDPEGGNALALGGKTRAEFDTEINENSSNFITGGYQIITDISQDIELKEGYYEIVDNENSQYSVKINSDLFIKDGEVIENLAGYVRLKGVKVPCKLAIREFPTLTNNTSNNFLEMNSNFPSSKTVKSLIKEVN
jgi:hypothetical protein